MSDVHLFHTNDGGEIAIANGLVELDHGPATAAYLSLFGGNDDDAGTDATEGKQWWGNLDEPDRARHLRSETQYLLATLPPVTSNLRRIEDAAARDLAWMETELDAELTVNATMPKARRMQLDIEIVVDATKTSLRFVEPWGSE